MKTLYIITISSDGDYAGERFDQNYSVEYFVEEGLLTNKAGKLPITEGDETWDIDYTIEKYTFDNAVDCTQAKNMFEYVNGKRDNEHTGMYAIIQ